MLLSAAVEEPILIGLLFLVGTAIGGVVNLWSIRLAYDDREPARDSATALRMLQRKEADTRWWQLLPIVGAILSGGNATFRGHRVGFSGLAAELTTGILFACFAAAYLIFDCQSTPEVQPDEFWYYGRLVFHLVLITFLIAATATDLRDYVVPDAITVPGTLIGIIAAAFSGQLQMIHLWVDWSQEIPGIRGPYIPAWLDAHRHGHGLAWSLAGAAIGGGVTYLVLVAGRWILGREAMGFGDVTLMAMIGSYIGWQPVVFVFFAAPITGLVSAVLLYVATGRTLLPYVPSLGAAAFGVICAWKWLWMPMRHSFGDGVLLAILGAVAFVALVILLWVMRWIFSKSVLPTDFDAP